MGLDLTLALWDFCINPQPTSWVCVYINRYQWELLDLSESSHCLKHEASTLFKVPFPFYFLSGCVFFLFCCWTPPPPSFLSLSLSQCPRSIVTDEATRSTDKQEGEATDKALPGNHFTSFNSIIVHMLTENNSSPHTPNIDHPMGYKSKP